VNLRDFDIADSLALKELIRERIRQQGPIGFDHFLRLALYHPTHGYYFSCDPTLDYQSSPNVHPVFGAMLARQVADFWRLLGRPSHFDFFESGAGSLRLAVDLLHGLAVEAPDL
jgi:SAM-dependent MidA family methyltransferase